MNADVRRLGRIRGLALIIGVLSLIVVAVSAYLRLDAAGLGCSDWPACYGGVLTGHPQALHYGFARLLHRITASAALILTVVLVWQCLRPLPVAAARPALLLLLLMLALSGLGFFSADPRRTLVGFLNIVGGLGLVSFSWRVVLSAAPGRPSCIAGTSLLFRLGILALSLTVLLGAWLGASYSAVACLSLPGCEGGAQAISQGWSILDPMLILAAPQAPGAPEGVLMHLLHRGLALLSLLLLGGALPGMLAKTGMTTAKTGFVLATVVLLLVGVTALGMAAVAGGLGLWLVVGHGIGAAMLLAAVATLLHRD